MADLKWRICESYSDVDIYYGKSIRDFEKQQYDYEDEPDYASRICVVGRDAKQLANKICALLNSGIEDFE